MPLRRAQVTAIDPNTIIAATQSQWISRFGKNEFTITANVNINPTTMTAQTAEAVQVRRAITRSWPVFGS